MAVDQEFPLHGRAPARGPVARFDDLRAGTTLQFSSVDRAITAWSPDEVVPALERAQAAADGGQWVFGFVAYEAASGLLPRARVHEPVPGLPLVWFGITRHPDDDPSWPPMGKYRMDDWVSDWTSADHAGRVDSVRAAIARGETYQCNLTTRLRGRVNGDLFALYRDLSRTQQGAFNAFLDFGPWAILSASPECFFQRRGNRIRSVPMKGTAARKPTPQLDDAARAALSASEKDRAENIMIVDLIRNDLSRVAVPGSVAVVDLLKAEKYPTVWQLTSAVEAELRSGIELPEIFRALFPCGSITGAPKLSTMSLIAELETAPRGLYCGAIGYLSPDATASFSVAIRTLTVDRRDGSACFGAGGGITYSSNAHDEYLELLAKTRVLQPRPEFDLLETFALRHGVAEQLSRHLDRLESSARYFDFACDRSAIERAARDLTGDAVVRLRLARDGKFAFEPRDLLPSPAGPVQLAVDDVPIDPDSPFAHHKTTLRRHLQAARERHLDADDTILVNPSGHVTETTIANLAARMGGTWFTPPLTDGCLPGVGRQRSLDEGKLIERSLTPADLYASEDLAVISSARGWRKAQLTGRP